MPGKTVGLSLNNGFAGTYARQPDMIVDTHPLGGSDTVKYGDALVYDADGSIIAFGATHTAANFVGVAAREVKSSLNYTHQGAGGEYQPGEAVSVFKRGSISVLCRVGTPKLNGKVYIRTVANEDIPTGVVGGFEAQADTGKTVELSNCVWRTAADANNVAEIVLKTRNNA